MFSVRRFLPALLLALCAPAWADWHLDGESSRLSFVTGVNGQRADVQRFLVLHGKVEDNGAASLRIEMDSVSSGVPVRDEAMRSGLFEVKRFPDATVSAQLDLAPINDLANGAQVELRLPLTLSLHGHQQRLEASLLATRLDARRFQVVTLEPLLLRVEDYGLAPGLDALRKAAKLDLINPTVPVHAVLIFNAR